MGADRREHDPWTPDLVEAVAAEIHAALPPEEWARNVRRRDHALMLLDHVRRTKPDAFTGFTVNEPAEAERQRSSSLRELIDRVGRSGAADLR